VLKARVAGVLTNCPQDSVLSYTFLKKRVTERKLPMTPIATPTMTRTAIMRSVLTASP
jgi:hypothetical protein